MAVSMLSVSLLLILFINIPKFRINFVLENIIYLVVIGLIYYSVTSIEGVFRSKNAYYPNFNPPANYLRGSLAHDQGKTI